MTDQLSHYGILGMRWGIRKQPDGTKARTGSAQDQTSGYDPDNPGIGAGGEPAKVTRRNRRNARRSERRYRKGMMQRQNQKLGPVSEDRYKSMDGKKVLLAEKGDTIYRVAASGATDVADRTYATVNKKDNDKYVALLSPGQGTIPTASKKAQMELSVNKDLVSPSEKQRVDSFIDSLDTTISVPDGENVKVGKGRDFMPPDPVNEALSNKELGLKYYNQFTQSQVLNSPLHEAYFDSIRKKGFNAIVDDADAGYMSDLPVILLDSKTSISVSNVTEIDESDIIFAKERLND